MPYDPSFFKVITEQFFTLPDADEASGELFKFQEFVGKYMNESSPYRGILLYYGLGAGKTRTAISACDSFIAAGKKVVVLLPASLHGNFELEFRNYVPKSLRGVPNAFNDIFTILHYNAGPSFAKSKKTDRDGAFDAIDLEGKVLIIDEMHNFVSLMANALRSKRYRGEAIYRKIMNTKNLRIIALSGTPVINLPFEVAILMNVLSGYKMSNHEQWDGTRDPIPLFPESEERFNEMYLDTTDSKALKIRKEAENDFCRRLVGHISYYGGLTGSDVYPNLYQMMVKVPMSNYQFNSYILQRETEILETNRALKMDNYVEKPGIDRDLMEKKSSFRASTREICNFAFPQDIERPWRRELAQTIKGKVTKKEKTISINHLDMEIAGEEIAQETESYYDTKAKIEQAYAEQLGIAVETLHDTQDIYLNSNIDIDDATYMEASNYIKLLTNKPNFSSEYETESEPYQVFTLIDEIKSHIHDSTLGYTQEVIKAKPSMAGPSSSQSETVTDTLYIYSPKMLAILYNLEMHRLADEKAIATAEAKGKEPIRKDGNVVVYSCFNKVEGITIFKYVLEAAGYEPYYLGQDEKSPGSKGRYCFWEGDDRARILEVFNSPENRYGDIIKILLITEAGAEGITVKNVRQMHIMEPYWNEVQIRQVIGRAKRMYSHKDLKKGERNVQVYRYKMTFTDEQKRHIVSKLGWRLDEQFTTDEVVSIIAEKKKAVTDQVERFMKQTAVDCFLNKADNDKHEEEPLVCYSVIATPAGPSASGKTSAAVASSSAPIETYKIGANLSEISKTSRLDLDKTEKKVTKFYKINIINDGELDRNEYVYIQELVSKKTPAGDTVEIVVLKIYLASALRSSVVSDQYLAGKVYLVTGADGETIFLSRDGKVKIKSSKESKAASEKVKYKKYEKNGELYLESH